MKNKILITLLFSSTVLFANDNKRLECFEKNHRETNQDYDNYFKLKTQRNFTKKLDLQYSEYFKEKKIELENCLNLAEK